MPKTYIEGGVYYITSRGDNNEEIFKDREDSQAYIKLIKKYKEHYGFKLFAFILMSNHLHLLVELKEGLSISNILHDLHSSYTKYFNAKYQRKGHVFQERCKMVIAETDSYLLMLTAYIHLNPKALGSKERFSDYPYGSFRIFAGLNSLELEGLDLKDEVSEINKKLAAISFDSYSAYIDSIDKAQMEFLGKELNNKILLGPEEFIKKIEKFLDLDQKQNVKAPEVSTPMAKRFKFAIAVVVCILAGFAALLIKENIKTKLKLKEENQQKELEFSKRLAEERIFINKDLQEKYKADMVSFDALAKRLEIEKKKARELENKAERKK